MNTTYDDPNAATAPAAWSSSPLGSPGHDMPDRFEPGEPIHAVPAADGRRPRTGWIALAAVLAGGVGLGAVLGGLSLGDNPPVLPAVVSPGMATAIPAQEAPVETLPVVADEPAQIAPVTQGLPSPATSAVAPTADPPAPQPTAPSAPTPADPGQVPPPASAGDTTVIVEIPPLPLPLPLPDPANPGTEPEEPAEPADPTEPDPGPVVPLPDPQLQPNPSPPDPPFELPKLELSS